MVETLAERIRRLRLEYEEANYDSPLCGPGSARVMKVEGVAFLCGWFMTLSSEDMSPELRAEMEEPVTLFAEALESLVREAQDR